MTQPLQQTVALVSYRARGVSMDMGGLHDA